MHTPSSQRGTRACLLDGTGVIMDPLSSLHLWHHLYTCTHSIVRETDNGGKEKRREPLQQWQGSLMALGIYENIFNLLKARREWRAGKNPGQEDNGKNEIEEQKWRSSVLACSSFCFTFQNLVINKSRISHGCLVGLRAGECEGHSI